MNGSDVRRIVQIMAVLLPWPIRRRICSSALGWQLHATSRIGLSIVDADRVQLGEGARIGHLNVIRDLALLELGSAALIGNWNWITAARVFQPQTGTAGMLRLGAESAITSRHYIDCSGGVDIGAFVTLAGVRSTVMTHQIDRAHGVQSISLVEIGDRSLISSNVTFVPGSVVPADSVVAMGAVVVGQLRDPNRLYAGVPARPIKELSPDDAYLHRSRAHVGLTPPVPRISSGPKSVDR